MTSARASEPNRAPRFAVFALGFRPFFLLAAGYAVVMMGLWLATLLGVLSGPVRGSRLDWHAHEMIFGVMGAVIAGFLLTAVRNWTQLPTPQGTPLAIMTVLWLAGRAAPWLDTVPAAVCAVADTAFLVTVLIAIAGPIVKTRTNKVRSCERSEPRSEPVVGQARFRVSGGCLKTAFRRAVAGAEGQSVRAEFSGAPVRGSGEAGAGT